jgi:hypothetical protein
MALSQICLFEAKSENRVSENRPRSRRRPLSATQHNPTTSLVGISVVFQKWRSTAMDVTLDLELLDVHFISSLPVKQLSACTAWGDKKLAQIVWAES